MKAWLRPGGRPSRSDGNAAPRFLSVARSHVGSVRAINEDRVLDCPQRCLWAVADGMGGHSGGDLAAQAIVDTLRALENGAGPEGATAMIAAIEDANSRILQRNRVRRADAGSTVVAAYCAAGAGGALATIAWAGDSRAYLLRRGVATQLTRDHSVVQDLVDAGLVSPQAAAGHPQANVITRALGIGAAIGLEQVEVPLIVGDRLLLCSDGLSRSARPATMAEGLPLETLAETLLAEALDRDGSDNISLALVEVAAAA